MMAGHLHVEKCAEHTRKMDHYNACAHACCPMAGASSSAIDRSIERRANARVRSYTRHKSSLPSCRCSSCSLTHSPLLAVAAADTEL